MRHCQIERVLLTLSIVCFFCVIILIGPIGVQVEVAFYIHHSCPWVGLTHGLGLVGLDRVFSIFHGLGWVGSNVKFPNIVVQT